MYECELKTRKHINRGRIVAPVIFLLLGGAVFLTKATWPPQRPHEPGTESLPEKRISEVVAAVMT